MTGNAEERRQDTYRNRLTLAIPAPLRRAKFRQLWLGMASSYAGNRFQQLAQADSSDSFFGTVTQVMVIGRKL